MEPGRYYLDPTREPRECPGRPFFGGPRTVYQHRAKIVCDTRGCGFEHVADPPEGVSYERHLRRDGKRCRKPSLRRSECFCHGTGRLGEEGAEPDVETFQGHERGPHPGKWFARVKVYRGAAPRGAMNPVYGPEDNEPAALAAARKAHRKES